MPGILVGAVVFNSVTDPMPIVISIIAGTLIGFSILMTFVSPKKGKTQAGLPTLCGGAIGGYVISSLLLHGELVGITSLF